MTTRAGAVLAAIGVAALIAAMLIVWQGGGPARMPVDVPVAEPPVAQQPLDLQSVPETATQSQGQEYSAEEAWDHIGEYATVVYRVNNPYRSGKGNIFLNEKQDYRNGFTGVIFANVAHRWSQSPTSLYGGRTVRVTGMIKTYEGHPEIIIESPEQVEVVD